MVVFGSTGYTGVFVAEELKRLQSEEGRSDLRWAAAGRSEDKVRSCLDASGIEGVDVIVADVNDQASLEAMCARATVLVNCVGPYQLYGEPVVQACISQKCHYVDITGETYFMESVEMKYGEQAREAGVYIVPACGFDCIPNDLGALILQRSFNGELVYVDSYMSINGSSSGFHTGTWESFLRSIKNVSKLTKLRRQRDKQLQLPSFKHPKHRGVFYSDVARKWCVPFPGPDRAVVYRSQMYRQDAGGTSTFKFQTYFGLQSLFQAVAMVICFMLLLPLVMTDFGFKLLLKYPGFFSGGKASKEGPSRKDLSKTTFEVVLKGFGYSSSAERSKPPDSSLTVKVHGIDPGYGATSAMLVQSALCLLGDSLPPTGGVYTTAAAFGDTRLLQNLENTGKVKFEVLPN